MPSKNSMRVLNEEIEILTTVGIDALWARMRGEFLAEWARLQRSGLSAIELEAEMNAFINGLSSKPLEKLARTGSGVAYN